MSRAIGYKHTEETIKKMSGKKHSEETKRKIGEGNRGKIVSEETRKKLSEAGKKSWKLNPNQGSKGKKNSPEHCAAISKAHKGKPTWNKGITGYSTSWKGGKMSEEARRHMRENHWSRTRPEEFKKVNERIRPRNPTIYEEKASKILDDNNIKYKQQYKIKTYCCDFYIPSLNLILEIDGYVKSLKRKQTIISEGYNLLHVWNKDVDKVIKTIFEVDNYERPIL